MESRTRALHLPAHLADDAVVDVHDEWLVRVGHPSKRQTSISRVDLACAGRVRPGPALRSHRVP